MLNEKEEQEQKPNGDFRLIQLLPILSRGIQNLNFGRQELFRF
jgi:hypothetical protein